MKFIVYLLTALVLPALSWGQDQPAVTAEKTVGTMTLWELVKSGGWAMVPLAVMSILAVMLIIAYMFTLRRGAVLSRHFMNTADVLLKKGDLQGLLSISARHSEAVARVVPRTLEFA